MLSASSFLVASSPPICGWQTQNCPRTSETIGVLLMRVEWQEGGFSTRRAGARWAHITNGHGRRALRDIGAGDRQCKHLRKIGGGAHAGSEIQRAVQSKHLIDSFQYRRMVVLRMVDGSGWNIGGDDECRDAHTQAVKGKVVHLELGILA